MNLGIGLVGFIVISIVFYLLWYVIRREAPIHAAFLWVVDLVFVLLWACAIGVLLFPGVVGHPFGTYHGLGA